jgi:hypothetical protein
MKTVEFQCDVGRCRLVETWRIVVGDDVARDRAALVEYINEELADSRLAIERETKLEHVSDDVSEEEDRVLIEDSLEVQGRVR